MTVDEAARAGKLGKEVLQYNLWSIALCWMRSNIEVDLPLEEVRMFELHCIAPRGHLILVQYFFLFFFSVAVD